MSSRHDLDGPAQVELAEFEDLPEPAEPKEEEQEEEEEEEEVYDVAFVRKIMDRPRAALCTFCGCYCAWVVLLIVLLVAGADVFPFSSDVPLYLRDSKAFTRSDIKLEGEEQADWFVGADGDQLARSVDKVDLELFWVSRDGSTVLTKSRLEDMLAVEQRVLDEPRYSASDNGFCTQKNGTDAAGNPGVACVRRDSVINFYNESFLDPNNISLSLYNNPLAQVIPDLRADTIRLVNEAWAAFNSSEMPNGFTLAPIWQVVSTEFGDPIGQDTAVAARAVFHFGTPIAGYPSALEDEDDQIDDIGQFLYDYYDDYLDSASTSDMRLYYQDSEDKMSDLKTEEDLITSMGLIVGSVTFVHAYISFMTGSFFIGTMAIFMLLIVFVPSLIIYTMVFNQQYFGVFNVLSLFIVLGIGADDVFVFVDHWDVSAAQPPNISRDQYTRMSWTFKKAGRAMAVTSVTTAFAFISNATSEFPGISTFGIFSATLVIINYIGIMSFFVSAMAVFYYQYERYPMCMSHRCCKSKRDKLGEERPLPGTSSYVAVAATAKGDDGGGGGGDDDDDDFSGDGDGNDGGHDVSGGDGGPVHDEDKLGVIPRFFSRVWFPQVVGHRTRRWFVLVFFFAFFTVFFINAVQLEPDPETPQLHKDGTNYAEVGTIKGRYFGARVEDPDEIAVFLVFGAAGLDRSGTNPTDRDDRGEIEWDPDFTIGTVAAQEFLNNICDEVVDTSNANPRQVKTGDVRALYCFMHDFRDWYNEDDTGKEEACYNGTRTCEFPARAEHCADSNPTGTDEDCANAALIRWAQDSSERLSEGEVQSIRVRVCVRSVAVRLRLLWRTYFKSCWVTKIICLARSDSKRNHLPRPKWFEVGFGWGDQNHLPRGCVLNKRWCCTLLE